MRSKPEIVVGGKIEQKILLIRHKKGMLDRDLAELYEVETKNLKRAVKRNLSRFPPDFMFTLTSEEHHSLRRQNGTLEKGAHSKYLPYAFTEHGILMLSSVLNSERAITINIHIMRVFTKLRELMVRHKDLEQRIDALEQKYNRKFKDIFEAIRQLLEPSILPPRPKLPIGFHTFQKQTDQAPSLDRHNHRSDKRGRH